MLYVDKVLASRTTKNHSGFTIIELLIVIAIVAILSAVVVVLINPAELLKQARDTQRTTDLDSLNNALKNAEFDGRNMGTSTIIYTSLPDTSSTCGSYGFTPPTGYTFHCTTSANYQKVDGNGWVPVNFAAVATLNISSLPVDPSNNATSSLYYSYIPGGSFELNTLMESLAFNSGGARDISSKDGGDNLYIYEKGTKLTLNTDRMPITPGNCTDSNVAAYFSADGASGNLTVPTGCAASGTSLVKSGTPTYRITSGVPRGLDGAIESDAGGDTDSFATAADVDALDIGTSSFVIEGWFYVVSGAATSFLGKKDASVAFPSYSLSFRPTESILSFRDTDNNDESCAVNITTPAGWHYYRAAGTPASFTCTVDSDPVTTSTGAITTLSVSNNGVFKLFNGSGTAAAAGSRIADLRITIGNSTNNLVYNNHWLPQP